jgi:hypothetical protein
MFSDPIEGSSSDVESFNEDDMYGTDSEIESIPLNAVRQRPVLDTDHNSVCIDVLHHLSVFTHYSGARHY